MRVIFMGSPAFALPTLGVLSESGQELVAVVTQPDKPSGRGRAWTPPPAKAFARERGIPVLQPVDVSAPPSVQRLRELAPDVIVVAAYGQILRRAVLEVPRRGSLNVHASLLPRHRGASPVAAAIIAGDRVTGVTIMEVVRALDAGPIVAQTEEPLRDDDTTGSLEARLAELGARLLMECLEPWAEGRLVAVPQDDALATYAPMVRRGDALIDWSLPAADIWRRVRAYNPWPIAHTRWRGGELRILEGLPIEDESGAPPGTVLGPERLPTGETTFSVQAGRGRLAVLRAQLPGRRALPGADLLRGRRDLLGSVLGVDGGGT
jgi:methionyl-tRNA formyltransferase